MKNLAVVDVEADRDAAGSYGLAQAIEQAIQTLTQVELGVGNEAAGIVDHRVQEALAFAALGILNIGAVEHVGLPDLIGVLRFKLLARGRRIEQLALGQAPFVKEAVQAGWGNRRRSRFRRERQLTQQRG